jgi:3-phosphoshikimate 1-carboxyvinyltransferase
MELAPRQNHRNIIQLPESPSLESGKLNVTVTPKDVLTGEIWAPPSKAHTHRALFAGLLSRGITKVMNPLSCDDTEATTAAISSLGARLEREPNTWAIQSNGRPTALRKEIQCGESGVTLRFTIPVASLTGEKIRFAGQEGLMGRPIEPLALAMKQLGVDVKANRNGVIVEGGPPKGGRVSVPGNVSSQFISGLLLAAPLMDEGLKLELASPLESNSYVSLTIDVMKKHGVEVSSNDKMSTFTVPPMQLYKPAAHRVSGDFSSAAFAMSAAAITDSKLLIRGLSRDSLEPDSVMVGILSKMGVEARSLPEGVLVEGARLKGINVDLRDCPDLGPIVAVLGCYAEGKTQITGASRLRYKESDRLEVIASELGALGADIKETEDGLIMFGPCSLEAGIVDSHGDHRIAMALSIAAIKARDQVVIKHAECVSKSYPAFFNDLRSLGVEVVGR